MKPKSRTWFLLLAAGAVAALSGTLIHRSGTGANVGCGGGDVGTTEFDPNGDGGVAGSSESLVWNRALQENDFNRDGRADIAIYRPGSTWATVPVLMSNGTGGWTNANPSVPAWANQPGVWAVPGEYNGDGASDVAFHRPGSDWATVPVLMSNGSGGWTSSNLAAPSWANQPGVIAIAGDFNSDGRGDIAFYRPGSTWATVPVLLSNGVGGWNPTNQGVPPWANQSGVVALPGDYNGDRRSDIAFHRPGGGWTSVPVLLSNGNGTWTSRNVSTPAWANEAGVEATAGDFNGDNRGDIAFRKPGGSWTTVPVLFGDGSGGWSSTQSSAPSWANQPETVAISGDFNSDYRTDIAFHRPGGTWNSVPILFGNSNGNWTSANQGVPSWANQSGSIALPGDYNRDYRTDIAFHRPGGGWNSVPVLISNGNGSWASYNTGVPAWANDLGVFSVGRQARSAPLNVASATDSGDAAYDQTAEERNEWSRAIEAWRNFLKLFVLAVEGRQAYIEQSGLNGRYDGIVSNGRTSAEAYLELQHQNSDVRGRLVVLQPTVELNGGVCANRRFPVSEIPIAATSSDAFHARGSTSRSVTMAGLFSGTVDITFNMTLETVEYQTLVADVTMDVPWPCADQSLSLRFTRRNDQL